MPPLNEHTYQLSKGVYALRALECAVDNTRPTIDVELQLARIATAIECR